MVFGSMLLFIGLLSGFFAIAAAQTNSCYQEGPSSPLALISESGGTVKQALSWWPLGRQCDWVRADGNGTVTTYSGNSTTSLATYGSLVLGGAGLVCGMTRRARAASPAKSSWPIA
jgi:hypothetical protein